MMLAHPKSAEGMLRRMENHHWRSRIAAGARQSGHAARHRRDGRLRHVGNLSRAHGGPSAAEDEALDLDHQLETRIKAGRPIPLVDIRVVDAEMQDVPHDGITSGEIVARAPWLTQGYLHDPANSEKLWVGGWLHTGDIGVIGPDGYLKVTDRLKDVIKTGGEWVSSLDIEDLILRHPGVSEVAVIGIPDPKWTERPLAVVVAKEGCSVSDARSRRAAGLCPRGVISRYAVPDQIVFVPTLPRTSVGKLDKKLLREQFGP